MANTVLVWGAVLPIWGLRLGVGVLVLLAVAEAQVLDHGKDVWKFAVAIYTRVRNL